MNPPARLTTEDLHRIRWLFGGLLVLVACWAIAPLDFGGGLLLLPLALAVALFLAKPSLSTKVPQAALRVAPPFIAFLVAADFFLSAPDFLPAILRMMILLLFYRALPYRTGREDLQLLLLAFFCVILSGVLTVSLLFALQILLFSLGAMCLMLLVTISEVSNRAIDPGTLWSGFRWRKFLPRVLRGLNLRLVSTGLVFFAFLVTLSSLIFVIMPRFELDRTFELFQLNTRPKSGFSETVALGNVSEITEDNSVALRIDVPSRDSMPPVPYWRMLVLDRYDGGTFEMSSWLKNTSDTDARRNIAEQHFADRRFSPSPGEVTSGPWIFYLEGGASRYLPLPGAFANLRFTQREDLQVFPLTRNIATRTVSSSWMSYRLDNLSWETAIPAAPSEIETLARLMQPDLREGDTEAVTPLPPRGRNEMTLRNGPALPYPNTTLELTLSQSDRETLRSLLREIGWDGESDVNQFSAQVIQWMHRRFQYSLRPDVPVGEGDPIIRWLTAGRSGHCELFAGGFLLMAREAGFPSRMIAGFTGGAWNEVENFFVVRNRHAHAWVEIYDARRQVWERIDPTPGSRGYNGSTNDGQNNLGMIASEQGWDAWVDSLRILWYRRVINFDDRSQTEIVAGLRARLTEINEQMKEWAKTITEDMKALLTQPFSSRSWEPLAALTAGGLLTWVIIHWRTRILALFSGVMRREKYDPARRQAGRALKILVPVLAAAQNTPGIDETILFTARDLRDELQSVRYGREAKSLAHAEALTQKTKKAVRRLRQEMRRLPTPTEQPTVSVPT